MMLMVDVQNGQLRSVGAGGGSTASDRRIRLMARITRKIAKAMIRKLTVALMKSP